MGAACNIKVKECELKKLIEFLPKFNILQPYVIDYKHFKLWNLLDQFLVRNSKDKGVKHFYIVAKTQFFS